MEIKSKAIDIKDFGGIPFTNTLSAARTNSAALEKALYSANATGTTVDSRTVWIQPSEVYYIMNVELSELADVGLQIDGKLVANNNISAWPHTTTSGSEIAILYFSDCTNLRVYGEGLIDGKGLEWWSYVIATGIDFRPHLFSVNRINGLEIFGGFVALNSPQYNFRLYDVINVHVRNITILIDTEVQGRLLDQVSRTRPDFHDFIRVREFHIPPPEIFALNTDGTIFPPFFIFSSFFIFLFFYSFILLVN